MQQQHGETQLNVIPSSASNEISSNKQICQKLTSLLSTTINEIMSSEILLNNSNNCILPRSNSEMENDILTRILLSDHDLKVMFTEAALDSCGDEGSFIFVTRCDNGQILFVSSTINNILNIRQEEWLNVNLLSQIHPGDQEQVKEQLIILNSEIDGGNDGRKNGICEGDECISTGMTASDGKLETNADRRTFNCRVRCRPEVIHNEQHSTLVNNNENSDIHSTSETNISNKESTVAGQNQNSNYLTVQCSGLIRKWPTSLISTKVNDDRNEQQLYEDEAHVHCLVVIARMKQKVIQPPAPAIPTLNRLNHQRMLSSTQLLPSTSVMSNNFNRIKQFTTKHTVNGNFIYVDQRITEALGYNTEELVDKCFFDYFYHDDCKFIKETFKFIPSLKGKPMTVTYRYWSKAVSYWIWLRIVIYTNGNNSNRVAASFVNYIVCDCTVLPNEVTADNINGTVTSTIGRCIASSTNRKPFNSTNYSNRFNQHQHHVQYNNTNNNNHKTVTQYNKDFILHRHPYHKQQQADNLSSIHADQPHQLTETIFASNNDYLNNDQSSVCQPFQLPSGPLTSSLQLHHHQPRTMMQSSQLDMYNNMLQIDNYLSGTEAKGGTFSEESTLMPPSTQTNWSTTQISNTFPSGLTEWSIQSTGELLPPTAATACHSANWSFLFNNSINKSNGNSWSSYVAGANSNPDLNSVEQQLDFWTTLDNVNATPPIWPPSDSFNNNNDALVYNCNNQQLSNSFLPTNMDINSFRHKSNWLTENVENIGNLSQFLYNNDNSVNAISTGVSNLTRSNIYNELVTGGITCTNEQDNQSNFYSELDIANIWSQMEREQQIQLQQLIISDNYGTGNNNSFEDLGLGNLIIPAQSPPVAAVFSSSNKNIGDEDSNDLQPWKLNEEMINNMYNMSTKMPTINRQQSTGSSPSTSPPTVIKTSSLLYTTNHGQHHSPNGNNILPQHSPRSSPPGNNSNILSRLPDLIEQVLHVDQTYNKHIITTTTTTTTTTATTITATNINNNTNTDINPIINQSIKTTSNISSNNLITSTPSSI